MKARPNSAVFEKLTPEFRAKIDRAIVDRACPTYKAIHATYKLEQHGINYVAFWRYAHRLRNDAELMQFDDLLHPEDDKLPDAMPRLVYQRLFRAVTQDGSTREVRDLVTSLKGVSKLQEMHRELAPDLDDLDPDHYPPGAIEKCIQRVQQATLELRASRLPDAPPAPVLDAAAQVLAERAAP